MRPLLILLGCTLFGCQNQPTEAVTVVPQIVDPATTGAREDSLALVAAYAAQSQIRTEVTASVETTNTRADALADAADDPAIWVHPTDPAKSLVFGTNKTGGLAAYDLSGREVAYYSLGNANNVDILRGVPFGGATIDLLGLSNRSDQSIDLFAIDPVSGALKDIAAGPLAVDPERIDDIYGFCLGRDVATGVVYAVLNGKNGVLEQFALREADGRFAADLVREVVFPSQTEGMVADNELGWLYVGEEAAGVWKLPLVPADGEPIQPGKPLAATRVGSRPEILADIEGVDLLDTGDGRGYLLVSIQGGFSYALFDRAGDNDYLGSFKIGDGTTIDGAEETDGLAVTNLSLPGFPRGLLVVQDGFNYDGDTLRPQNFKYVDWGAVAGAMGLSHSD